MIKHPVLHMASFRQAVVVLSIGFVGCSSPAPDPLAETSWGAATVVEELGIGVESGPDEYMFGSIRYIAAGVDGTVYVVDGRPLIVRAYDADGVFLRNIGGPGQGPGEFRYAPALQVLPDGTLVAWDYGGRRVQFFSAEGECLDSFPAAAGVRQLYLDLEGHIYVRAYADDSRSEWDHQVVKYTVEGEELGREAFPPEDMDTLGTFVLGSEGDIFAFPEATRSAWSPLGYVVTGRNSAYDIELRKPSGTVRIRRDLATIPVGPEEHAEWETFRESLVQRSLAAGRENQLKPVPETKPFFREIYVGQDGRIWVFRYVAAKKRDDIQPLPERPERPLLTWREPWTYDVFEPDGTFLGSVEVPELFQPFVFRGDQIWGASLDEDSVERVRRLRVVPEVR